MFKRFEKWTSCMLVLALLLEMLPATFWGSMVQHAYAAECSEFDQGYSSSAPQESDNGITAEIPDVIIDGTNDAQNTSQLTMPTLTEADQRYISILSSYALFSQLSQADAAFFASYTGSTVEIYTELETTDLSLAASVNCARLISELGCSVSQAIALDLSDDEFHTRLTQIAIYKNLLCEEFIGTATDFELRSWLLKGYSAEQVLNAYGASKVFELELSALLESDSGRTMPPSLSSAEAAQIQSFSDTLGIEAIPVAEYTVSNNLTIADIEAQRETIDLQKAQIMITPQSSSTGSSDDSASETLYLNAPYTYSSGDQEDIALNSGALIIEAEDYVLPGVNGLDLVIGRRYNSQEASSSSPCAKVGIHTEYAYYVLFGCRASYYVPGIGSGSWSYYDEDYIAGPFTSHSAAKKFADTCPTGTIRYPDFDDGADLILNYYVSIQSVVAGQENYVYSSTKSNSFLNNMYGLGHGWSLLFSSIETVDSKQYLHLSDGSSYEVNFSASGSHLKDYTLTDMVLEKNRQDFTNGEASSQYCLTYQDGKREYFSSDGKLIGIQDRYNNVIKLIHSTENGYPHITITDTLGRTTIISGQSSAAGHVMEVSLPDGSTLQYAVTHDGDTRALALYTDATGETTQYSYTKQAAWFDVLNKRTSGAANEYLNLTTITHPTMAQSVYTYAVTERNLGEDGLAQIYRITSREDRLGTTTANRQTYSYSTNDCSGYPAARNPEKLPESFRYSTTVTDANGAETTAIFNNKHLKESVTVSFEGTKLRKEEYVYNADKLPVRETVQTYSVSNQSSPLIAVTMAEYDKKGNITASWSALADGDDDNAEHKTSYTYDSTYGLVLSKTWKTNEDTTVWIQNTLDTERKNIVRTECHENGVLISRADYSYDSYGNVISEKHYLDNFADYELIEFAYQANAWMSQKTYQNVLTADGTYADSSSAQDSGTITTRYTYDDLGRIIAYIDGNGNTTAYAYDALGGVTRVTNPDDTSVCYGRDYVNNAVTVTDENGAQIKYTYTPLGLEYETVDVQTGSVISRKEYDNSSRLIRERNYVYGAVTEYAYDVQNRLTTETVWQRNTMLSQTLYVYDDAAENGQYQKVTKTVVGDSAAPSVITTQYTDKNGNVVKTGKILNNIEYLDLATYDYAGNVLTQLTAADAAKGLPYTAKYVYNANGQVTTSYHADGQSAANTYDALGRLVQATDYAGTPTRYSYDALGRLLTQSITVETGVEAVSKYDYDACGNIIREWKPVNAVGEAASWAKTEYDYDSRGRLTAVRQYDGAIIAAETTYTYDGVGNLLTMTVGSSTTSYTYDRFGNVLTETDALGQAETRTYSSLGCPLSKTDRNGTVTTYVYDALGRMISATAGRGRDVETQKYAYTKTGQIRTEENGNQRTSYTYDELGQVIRVEEAELKLPPTQYTVTLNANGGEVSPSTVTVFDGGVYDLPTPVRAGYAFAGWYFHDVLIANGDTVSLLMNSTFTARWVAEDSYTVVYCRNPHGIIGTGEITKIYQYDQDVIIPSDLFTRSGYRFDAWRGPDNTLYMPGSIHRNLAGRTGHSVRLYAQWSASGISTMSASLDPATLPDLSESGALVPAQTFDTLLNYTKSYTYDLAGNRTGFVLKKDSETIQDVTYTYDNLNRLSTVSEGSSLQAVYTYDANGNRASLTYANGVTTTYGYNKANWVTGLQNTKDGTILSGYTYTYYASGSQRSKRDHTGKVTSYVYDDLGRLICESEDGVSVHYTYDANGNRVQMTATGGSLSSVTTYTYDAGNHLLTETRAPGNAAVETTAYTYDGSGNLLERTSARADGTASTVSYRYNGFNQLTACSVGGTTVFYAYNARGIRTVKQAEGFRTAYLLDGGDVVAEVRKDAVIGSYLRGANLIRRESGAGTEYYLFNAHGDVVQLTDDRGNITGSYDYDAFGKEKNPDSADYNPFRYCGEYLDSETGTYYLRARYYDPTIGRFTQQDTHWNTANMIYSDNPQKINEREDALGLKTYTHVPQITAIMQAGNLYVYGINNPAMYRDANGESIILASIIIGAIVGAAIGGIGAAAISNSRLGYVDAKWVLIGAGGGAVLGGLVGWGVGAAITAIGATATAGCGGTLGSTIYATWQQAEQSLRDFVGSVTTYAERVFSTPFGNRIVDAFNKTDGIIAEAKYGYVSLTDFIQAQIAKDAFLLQTGKVEAVEWHFFVSAVTGKGGPSAPLLEELLRQGFTVIFH